MLTGNSQGLMAARCASHNTQSGLRGQQSVTGRIHLVCRWPSPHVTHTNTTTTTMSKQGDGCHIINARAWLLSPSFPTTQFPVPPSLCTLGTSNTSHCVSDRLHVRSRNVTD
ncbi:hypothetical protein C0Q70_19709 [Pomacea canaliculata]|uniref:Uncharacterized protein n=1 Tax=Pomacea canaliculata TaxID=400727 RepID=A0A2T7NDH1_POMCA|nr:hypothetical protein C0Q70_19709 [Pomacea canaliculata]